MTISKICKNKVITLHQESSVNEAACLMKQENIGDIVITENDFPVGILTDRDIVTKVIAEKVNAESLIVKDVMSSDLLLLKDYQTIGEAIEMMSAKGVRRAPVIDSHNKILGIVSFDDIFILISNELYSLSKLITKQIIH